MPLTMMAEGAIARASKCEEGHLETGEYVL